MKFTNTLQVFKKCIILFTSGLFCTIVAYIMYMTDPVTTIFQSQLNMAPNTLAFTLWRKPPIDVFLRVYIFNVTNHEEFLAGQEKLKVKEIGPYVYKEILENVNITWHEDAISYVPKRTIEFIREMSVGDPEEDIVIAPNIPMLGITSALHDASFFINFPWARLINMLDSKPILNITVHDYLWGYEDRLVRLASSVVPSFINFRKFGLLDRMYDEGDNVVSMNIKRNENMTDEIGRYLSIDTYNGSPGLPQWGYRDEEGNETHPENTICNRIRGATEATLFPSHLDSRASFRVFRKAFCKAIPIVFKEKIWVDNGLEGYMYSISDKFLQSPDLNPENECYCRKMKTCLKNGLSDITPCYYSIPTAISLPHFLNGDPDLFHNVEGLQPDPKLHTTRVVVQPTIGIPMEVNSKLQINMVMHHTTYNSKVTPFNDMVVPLFWMDLDIPTLPSYLILLLKMALQVLPVTQTILICLLGIGGATCILLSFSSLLWAFNQQEQQQVVERRDSLDLRIPLSYGQYTSIHILPSIKKITSKTDLFN